MFGISRSPIDFNNVRFDFYIDSVRGDDSYSGTSRGRAFASSAPLNGTLDDGTRVGIAGGSNFSLGLDVIGNDLLISSYGPGPRPHFNCAESLSSGGWIKTEGRTNVYQRTITLPNSVKAKGNIYEDGIALTQVTTLDACDATPGRAYVTDWTAASATLYLHPTGSSNPASNGKAYSYTRYLRGIFVDGDRAKVIGIHTSKNAHQDGSLVTTGEDCIWQNCLIEDGCRHAALAGAGLHATSCTFKRASNTLEPPTSNLLVINQTAVLGKSYRLTRCVFDGENGNAVTAVSNHGANAADLFSTCYQEQCTYKDLVLGVSIVSDDLIISDPVLQNVTQFALFGANGAKVTIVDGSGTCNQLIKAESNRTGITTVLTRGSYTIPVLSTFGFVNYEATSGTNAVNVTDLTAFIQSYSGNGDFFRVKHGTITRSGVNIGPNTPTTLNRIDRLGQDGGTGTLVASNNRFPYGASYLINGTTRSLSSVKANLSQEIGTTADGNGGVPSNVGQVFFSDEFDRADENLETNANWIRLGGAAGQAAVRSNQLAMIGTTQTAYYVPSIGQTDFFVEFTIAQVPASGASFPVAFRIVDQNNFLGIRWSSTQFQAFRCVANVFNGFATVNQPPNVGDVVRVVVKGLVCTCFVNEIQIFSTSYGAAAMDNSHLAGCVPRSAALNPAIDSFRYGYA